jgi:hypothetical protein
MPGSYKPSEEMINAMARKIAKDRLAPRVAEVDRMGESPWDIGYNRVPS